jgi:hypothetical protein
VQHWIASLSKEYLSSGLGYYERGLSLQSIAAGL